MPKGSARRKVVGGKLVHVDLEHDGSIIRRVRITGDFFLHPEEALDTVEASLVLVQVSSSLNSLRNRIQRAFDAQGARAVGMDAQVLAELVREALGASNDSAAGEGPTESPTQSPDSGKGGVSA